MAFADMAAQDSTGPLGERGQQLISQSQHHHMYTLTDKTKKTISQANSDFQPKWMDVLWSCMPVKKTEIQVLCTCLCGTLGTSD